MSNLVRIIAVVVDTQKAVFYTEDGSTIEIAQGDSRLRTLVEKSTSRILKDGYVDMDFSSENIWKQFEEKSGGAVRLFKIAKDKLKSLLGRAEPVPTQSVGTLPVSEGMGEKLENIFQHAESVSQPTFVETDIAKQRPTVEADGRTPGYPENESDSGATHTIIAVTPEGHIVPNVERIKSQFANAARRNPEGLVKFIERCGSIAKERGHAVEDLLRFLERGDLPLANDGSVIAYKRLISSGDGVFVDCHSKRVRQRVGSIVEMDPKMVDHDRRIECSQGLHVARRGYLRNFHGDVTVLIRFAPEDVIAVPYNDANKIRVCRYQILFQLTKEQADKVNSNFPITEAPGGAELLSRAISGDFPAPIEVVQITEANGGGLVIKPVENAVIDTAPKPENPVEAAEEEEETILPESVGVQTLESEHGTAAPVDPKKVAKAAVAIKTRAQLAKEMYAKAVSGDKEQAQALLALKKKSKKSWTVLGLHPEAGQTLNDILG